MPPKQYFFEWSESTIYITSIKKLTIYRFFFLKVVFRFLDRNNAYARILDDSAVKKKWKTKDMTLAGFLRPFSHIFTCFLISILHGLVSIFYCHVIRNCLASKLTIISEKFRWELALILSVVLTNESTANAVIST